MCWSSSRRAIFLRNRWVRMAQSVAACAFVLVFHVGTAAAQATTARSGTAPENRPSPAAEVLAKGVLGNLLEVIPLQADERAQLQRFNAVVGSPFTARTLAIALGVANPPLMIVGLIWGLWSATQIKPRDADVQEAVAVTHTPQMLEAALTTGTSLIASAAAPDGSANNVLDRLSRSADASALASVVGGASASDRPIACDYCVMPMIYPREASVPR
jgi:uncharacterized protein with beta-barrel porin domain